MKARILILFLFWTLLDTISAHPIHVSVVNIDYISDSNRIDLSVRLFYDDFQSLINYKYDTELDFTRRTRLTSKEQKAIIDYIASSLILSDENAGIIKTRFTGWRIEDMSVWLYFCANEISDLNRISIKNTLMLDLFTDQKNLVIAGKGDKQLAFEFDKRSHTDNILF